MTVFISAQHADGRYLGVSDCLLTSGSPGPDRLRLPVRPEEEQLRSGAGSAVALASKVRVVAGHSVVMVAGDFVKANRALDYLVDWLRHDELENLAVALGHVGIDPGDPDVSVLVSKARGGELFSLYHQVVQANLGPMSILCAGSGVEDFIPGIDVAPIIGPDDLWSQWIQRIANTLEREYRTLPENLAHAYGGWFEVVMYDTAFRKVTLGIKFWEFREGELLQHALTTAFYDRADQLQIARLDNVSGAIQLSAIANAQPRTRQQTLEDFRPPDLVVHALRRRDGIVHFLTAAPSAAEYNIVFEGGRVSEQMTPAFFNRMSAAYLVEEPS